MGSEYELEEMRSRLLDLGVDAALLDVTAPNEWVDLARVQRLWGCEPRLTVDAVAEVVGLSPEMVRRMWARLGFPDPGDRAVFRESDLVTFQLGAAGIEVFGLDATERFGVVIGLAVRRITEAASALLADNAPPTGESPASELDASGVAIALLISVAEEILPAVVKHSVEASNAFLKVADATGSGSACIGFCDLVGSTALLNDDGDGSTMAGLRQFERRGHELVVQHHGVVIKFVGDEMMWTVPEPENAVTVGRALLDCVRGIHGLGVARVGIAIGPVVRRDGDLYGPTVHRAARLVAAAAPDSLVVDANLTEEGPLTELTIKGFSEPVPTRRLLAAP